MGAAGSIKILPASEGSDVSTASLLALADAIGVTHCYASRYKVSGLRRAKKCVEMSATNRDLLHDAIDAFDHLDTEFLKNATLDMVAPFVRGAKCWSIDSARYELLERVETDIGAVSPDIRGDFLPSALIIRQGPQLHWTVGDDDIDEVVIGNASVSLFGYGWIRNRLECYKRFASLPVVTEIARMCEPVFGPSRVLVTWDC